MFSMKFTTRPYHADSLDQDLWRIEPFAKMGWALSLCNHEDGLWEVARHLQMCKTFGQHEYYDRNSDTNSRWVKAITVHEFTSMSYKIRLNYILAGIVKYLLDHYTFKLKIDGFKNQLWIAEQLTGIKPPNRTTTPLRKCLDRYFDASLEVGTLEAIQSAMYQLSLRWRGFVVFHAPTLQDSWITTARIGKDAINRLPHGGILGMINLEEQLDWLKLSKKVGRKPHLPALPPMSEEQREAEGREKVARIEAERNKLYATPGCDLY